MPIVARCRAYPRRVESDPGGSRERRTGPRHRRHGFRRGALRRAAARRRLPRAHDASVPRARRRRARPGASRRCRPHELEFAQTDLTHDDGWPEAVDGASYVLHVASPFPVRQPKDANELIIAGPRGDAPRAAGGTRCGGTAGRADVVVRGDRLRHRSRSPVHRGGLDRPVRPEPHPLRAVEDDRRARRVGLHRPGGRRPRARGREPRADLRSGARTRPLDLRRAAARTAERSGTGRAERHDHRSRRARRRRPAPAGDDASGCRGRAFPRRSSATPSPSPTSRSCCATASVPTRNACRRGCSPIGSCVRARSSTPSCVRSRRSWVALKAPRARRRRRMLGWDPHPLDEAILASAESLVRLGLVKP